jgi:hypothetical protein
MGRRDPLRVHSLQLNSPLLTPLRVQQRETPFSKFSILESLLSKIEISKNYRFLNFQFPFAVPPTPNL